MEGNTRLVKAQRKKITRNWINKEVNLFVEILTDEEFNFAVCLKKKTKHSANKEVFQEILKVFDAKLRDESFIQKNGNNFGKGNYSSLEFNTKKLQIKYNSLKKKRRELKDRPKKGSGLEPEKHPDSEIACLETTIRV